MNSIFLAMGAAAPIAFLEKYHENRAEISEKEAP